MIKDFSNRHIGISDKDLTEMLETVGVPDLETLINETIPGNIRVHKELSIPAGITERAFLKEIRNTSHLNRVFRSFIGQGYYGTITPSVIARNIFQNPGWYTQYTPYQAEIAQGRLEALLNFQTMVSDLCGLPMANASLLDEGTAAAEAMSMFYDIKNKKRRKDPATKIFIDSHVFPQTLSVVRSRAWPLGITIETGNWKNFKGGDGYFAVLVQFPNSRGSIENYSSFIRDMAEKEIFSIVASDLLSLTLITPPGEWGADAVVGNTQRFGVPMGFGGPHAAYFATREEFKRQIPGRIIGVSVDSRGKEALRMALQTREQHIKRERATSNICTAQALLAIMAGMYGVYHGPDGLKEIAREIHQMTCRLHHLIKELGFKQVNEHFFDTLRIKIDPEMLPSIRDM
jgi:glycine dehydrogenase